MGIGQFLFTADQEYKLCTHLKNLLWEENSNHAYHGTLENYFPSPSHPSKLSWIPEVMIYRDTTTFQTGSSHPHNESSSRDTECKRYKITVCRDTECKRYKITVASTQILQEDLWDKTVCDRVNILLCDPQVLHTVMKVKSLQWRLQDIRDPRNVEHLPREATDIKQTQPKRSPRCWKWSYRLLCFPAEFQSCFVPIFFFMAS